MIVIITTTTVEVPEERDRLLSGLARATPPTLRESGVLEYRSSMAPNDPSVVHAVEIYASEDAILAHLRSDHMAVLLDETSDIRSEISVKGYRGELEPFDISALLNQATLGGNPAK
jgi:quinol monooxygenase YgiN